MKLYSYSKELLNFVEVKWIKTKYIALIALLGSIIFLAVVVKTQSLDLLKVHSTNVMQMENAFLQQQIFRLVPRVNAVETQLKQLNNHSDILYGELHNGPLVKDSVFHFTNAAIGSFLHALNTGETQKNSIDTGSAFGINIIVVKK